MSLVNFCHTRGQYETNIGEPFCPQSHQRSSRERGTRGNAREHRSRRRRTRSDAREPGSCREQQLTRRLTSRRDLLERQSIARPGHCGIVSATDSTLTMTSLKAADLALLVAFRQASSFE